MKPEKKQHIKNRKQPTKKAKTKNGKKQWKIFPLKDRTHLKPLNLKLQILVGFVIPIFIVIGVGFYSYEQAAKGLIETFENSNITSIEMASQLIDFGLQSIISSSSEITSDSNFLNYVSRSSTLTSLLSGYGLEV